MLKRINNDIDHIKHDGSSTGSNSGYDAAAAAAEAARQACLSNKDSKISAAQNEIDNCTSEIAKIDEALSKLDSNVKRLEEISNQYATVQSHISECWTSETKINGFETMQDDIDCIKNFNTIMSNERESLTQSKEQWDTKKGNAQKDLTDAQSISC